MAGNCGIRSAIGQRKAPEATPGALSPRKPRSKTECGNHERTQGRDSRETLADAKQAAIGYYVIDDSQIYVRSGSAAVDWLAPDEIASIDRAMNWKGI